jgi:hypothetical protein
MGYKNKFDGADVRKAFENLEEGKIRYRGLWLLMRKLERRKVKEMDT